MKLTGTELLDELLDIHLEETTLVNKYPRIRTLLERACKELTANESVSFTTLFTRLTYLCKKFDLSPRQAYEVNGFRVRANKLLHEGLVPDNDTYAIDLKAVATAFSRFYNAAIPFQLIELSLHVKVEDAPIRFSVEYRRLRAVFSSKDDNYLYVYLEDFPSIEPVKVKYGVNAVNDLFQETIRCLWEGCLINLLDVAVQVGVMYPGFIVLEPDYLIDATSLAENFKDYGTLPLNYLLSKFNSVPNSKAILTGYFANILLDDFLVTPEVAPDFRESCKKAFKQYPFEFATCQDLKSEGDIAMFVNELSSQFNNITRVVDERFQNQQIDKRKAIIEPSFLCEPLGIQGRLDVLQEDFRKLIELKAGRMNDWPPGTLTPKQNNSIQTLLYVGMLAYSIGIPYNQIMPYLLYSKYSDLFYVESALRELKKVIDLRNQIVYQEWQLARSEQYCIELCKKISADQLNTNKLSGKFWETYLKPSLDDAEATFSNNSVALSYFFRFFHFVEKEHFLCKLQVQDFDKERIGSYWMDFDAKKKNGEILYDLQLETIVDNVRLTFKIPSYEDEYLPNFRVGDVVVIYQRNTENDFPTNKQIFKGNVESVNEQSIVLLLRNKQQSEKVLPKERVLYAVEHDILDSTFVSMYRGLYLLLEANEDRKRLLLGQRDPGFDPEQYMSYIYDDVDIQRIVWKSIRAKDYFLLIGPPGSGKTSRYLRAIVNEHLRQEKSVLLLAYTNRAVDEICKAIASLEVKEDYIRIGSKLSCDQAYWGNLLESKIEDCSRIAELRDRLKRCRIYVSTVASISSKFELFKLKAFDVAVIDEASQILEPALVGLLSAKGSANESAIKKFILIGDHKQLPAVVVQPLSDSVVENEYLNNIGIKDCRMSLFERLYRANSDRESQFVDMIKKHGRMHPVVAKFPNYCFYNNQLKEVPTAHQDLENFIIPQDNHRSIEQYLVKNRISFIQAKRGNDARNFKTNLCEAKYAAKVVSTIFSLLKQQGKDFDPQRTIGVITPYRSQIALIKKEISAFGIPELKEISIDTVERYQGSERDFIVFSFCASQYYQVDHLANNIIIDNKQIIDRKLNVALTRAREQVIILGDANVLCSNYIYFRLIEFISASGGLLNVSEEEFLSGNFSVPDFDSDINLAGRIYEPDASFVRVFNSLVIDRIKSDVSTSYPSIIYGKDHQYNRLNVIEFGCANFDEPIGEVTPEKKVLLYCYYNMRKHYFSSRAVFSGFSDYFKLQVENCGKRIVFLDFGCGPLTSGLAFFNEICFNVQSQLHYIGIDTSREMEKMAIRFAGSEITPKNSSVKFYSSFGTIPETYWTVIDRVSNLIIINCCYFFGNLEPIEAEKLAGELEGFINKYPLNKYVFVYQNSALYKRNRSYEVFRKRLKSIYSLSGPRIETISYRNSNLPFYDKSEEVYYEILESR